jgi:hypothetical protein
VQCGLVGDDELVRPHARPVLGVRSPRGRREFLPTVWAARLREAADNADGAACADAVSEHAAPSKGDELPEAVRVVTSGRG